MEKKNRYSKILKEENKEKKKSKKDKHDMRKKQDRRVQLILIPKINIDQ